MATIVVFASSLFLALVLIVMKAVELKRGKPNFILKKISLLDPKSEKLVALFKFKSLQLIQSVRYIILVQIKEAVRDWLIDVQNKILIEYKKRHDIIMGQKMIANHGSASFYLRKITEHRGSDGKGKIEDNL